MEECITRAIEESHWSQPPSVSVLYKALWSLIIDAVILKVKSKTKAAPAAAATNHVSRP